MDRLIDMRRIVLLALFGLMATGCLGSDFEASIEGSWQLESGTVNGQPIPIVSSHPITMTLEDGEIGGTAACNGYGGRYRVDGSEFGLENGLAITEMACGPMEIMDSEQSYMQALTMVDTIEVGNGGLVLSGDGTELSFVALPPVPTADMTDTLWVLEGLIEGDTVSTPVQGSRATLELLDDGTFTGSTGCRTISGQYQISGAEVRFTDWSADGDCPDELVEQDSDVISALEGGFRVEIEGEQMTTWVSGDEGLVYRADS